MTTSSEFILAFIDDELSAEELTPVEVAQRVHDRMMSECAQEADQWLHDQAVKLLTVHIRHILSSRRSLSRSQRPARVFSEVAKAANIGDREPLIVASRMLDAHYRVNDDNLQKTLGSCDGKDLAYVSKQYQSSAERDALLAAFYRTCARLAGKKTLGDVVNEEQVRKVYTDITNEKLADAPSAGRAA